MLENHKVGLRCPHNAAAALKLRGMVVGTLYLPPCMHLDAHSRLFNPAESQSLSSHYLQVRPCPSPPPESTSPTTSSWTEDEGEVWVFGGPGSSLAKFRYPVVREDEPIRPSVRAALAVPPTLPSSEADSPVLQQALRSVERARAKAASRLRRAMEAD